MPKAKLANYDHPMHRGLPIALPIAPHEVVEFSGEAARLRTRIKNHCKGNNRYGVLKTGSHGTCTQSLPLASVHVVRHSMSHIRALATWTRVEPGPYWSFRIGGGVGWCMLQEGLDINLLFSTALVICSIVLRRA